MDIKMERDKYGGDIRTCKKCGNAFLNVYISINDKGDAIAFDSRKSYLENKFFRNKISQELWDIAKNFIKNEIVFEMLECNECGEVYSIIKEK